MEEKEIVENAFSLIFAFDEIVALGYRESVNLSQIKTFVEMDSHEEKVYQAVRQTQEREAKMKMREKAKELQRQRMEATKKGFTGRGFSGISETGFGSSSSGGGISNTSSSMQSSIDIKPAAAAKPAPVRNAMKLGGKNKDVDSFVDQLKSEGEKISSLTQQQTSAVAVSKPKATPDVPTERYVILEPI